MLSTLSDAHLPDMPFFCGRSNEVGSVRVILFQELKQVLHLFGAPVGEGTGDHGQAVVEVRVLVRY